MYLEKTQQNYKIIDLLETRQGDVIAIFVRISKFYENGFSYGAGIGYHVKDGTWNYGRYDYETLSDIINSLTEDYGKLVHYQPLRLVGKSQKMLAEGE